jgi:hypothetical protein
MEKIRVREQYQKCHIFISSQHLIACHAQSGKFGLLNIEISTGYVGHVLSL